MSYDSRPDTYEHIALVRAYMLAMANELIRRAHVHDDSKLRSPEVEVFDEFTPKLRELTYGSPEYHEARHAMGEGLLHHYAFNDHHPEHHGNGIGGMHLVQLLEMVCDWMAATYRMADGDIHRSIEQNAERFDYGPELTGLLHRTADFVERKR